MTLFFSLTAMVGTFLMTLTPKNGWRLEEEKLKIDLVLRNVDDMEKRLQELKALQVV